MTQNLNPDCPRTEQMPEPNLAETIRRRFAPFGGVDLELPPDEMVGASIATRDTGGFSGCGLAVIDPWTAP
jgi:hypothetical protein